MHGAFERIKTGAWRMKVNSTARHDPAIRA
jgi:hypothetical protein